MIFSLKVLIVTVVILRNDELAIGSRDNNIKIWGTIEEKELKTLSGHYKAVRRLVILPNDSLASGSEDSTIKFGTLIKA